MRFIQKGGRDRFFLRGKPMWVDACIIGTLRTNPAGEPGVAAAPRCR